MDVLFGLLDDCFGRHGRALSTDHLLRLRVQCLFFEFISFFNISIRNDIHFFQQFKNWFFVFSFRFSSNILRSFFHFFCFSFSFCNFLVLYLFIDFVNNDWFLIFTFSVFMSSLIYPVIAHWSWSNVGWLSTFNPTGIFIGNNFIDFAGTLPLKNTYARNKCII